MRPGVRWGPTRQPFRRRHRTVLPYASPPVLFLEGPLCSSYVGFFGSMLLDSATAGGKAMVAYASHAARFFAPARGNLLVILRKWKAPSGNTVQGAANDSCARYLRCYR